MKNLMQIEQCCGCGACVAKCPTDCIAMGTDKDGFYKPILTSAKCINCGICVQVCPMVTRPVISEDSRICGNEREVFAAVTNNNAWLQRSASGGLFSVFAQHVLEQKGVVFACGYDQELVACQQYIEHIEDLDKLRRSKYVQSDTKETYSQVQDFLLEGRVVLYTGTPCQIAGLRNYLSNKPYENLYLVDLICHGVPSAKMFAQNLKYFEKKAGEKITTYEFRLKNKLGRFEYVRCYESGKQKSGIYYKDPYYNAFYDGVSYNEACYVCPYANLERVGDITIGDFGWAKQYYADFAEYPNVSCAIVNSKKGQKLLFTVKNSLILQPSELKYVIERNKNLIRPTVKSTERNKIYFTIEKKGYTYWAQKYYRSLRYYKKMKPLKYLVDIKIRLKQMLKKELG